MKALRHTLTDAAFGAPAFTAGALIAALFGQIEIAWAASVLAGFYAGIVVYGLLLRRAAKRIKEKM